MWTFIFCIYIYVNALIREAKEKWHNAMNEPFKESRYN